MKESRCPQATGISEITGKIVSIRHALESDMVFVEEILREAGIDTQELDYRQFVVATENGEIVGAGRLRKIGEMHEMGCVAVAGEKRRRGIGSMIVRHLMEYSPAAIIYVTTDLVDYFRRFGFTEMKEGAKELMDALDEACRISGKPATTLMVYEKR